MVTDTYLIAETDRRQRQREAKSRQLAAYAAAVIEPQRDPRAISEPDAQHPLMYANTAQDVRRRGIVVMAAPYVSATSAKQEI